MIRNIKRIDHVAGLVRSENLDSLVARMADVLQIKFDGPFERSAGGYRIAVALDPGIELIAPTTSDPDNPFNKMLAARGEHWMTVVFGVENLDATCDHLARMGYTPQRRGSTLQGNEPYLDRIVRAEQASFEPELFHGLPWVFSEIEGRDAD
jgi:hypothetical protein